MENTPYKSNLYVSGVEPHLVEHSFWQKQLAGFTLIETSLPLDGVFQFQKSGQSVVCGVKNDAKRPVIVVDNANKELQGSAKDLIKEGALVVVHFIPYPWESGEKTGISVTVKKIKIVTNVHVGPTVLAGAKRESPSLDGSPSPKRTQAAFIYADDLPSTEGFSFITGE